MRAERREAPRRRPPLGQRLAEGRLRESAAALTLNEDERSTNDLSPSRSCSSSAATRIARDADKRRPPRPLALAARRGSAAASAEPRCLDRSRTTPRGRQTVAPDLRFDAVLMRSESNVAHTIVVRARFSGRAARATNERDRRRPSPGPRRRARRRREEVVSGRFRVIIEDPRPAAPRTSAPCSHNPRCPVPERAEL